MLNAYKDDESHFHQALEHWRQLNLSQSFLQFANKAGPMSASMPLLLHNWKEIVDCWIGCLEGSDDEGLRPLLEYVSLGLTFVLRTHAL